jgi:hypothetical protein
VSSDPQDRALPGTYRVQMNGLDVTITVTTI